MATGRGKRNVRKSPLRRKSKNPKAVMKHRAWAELRQFVLIRDNWTCVTCGKKVEGMDAQGGHYIHGVTNTKLWLDPLNVHCQCKMCNLYLSGNLAKYTLYLEDKYGRKTVDRLLKLKEDRKKLDADRPTLEWYESVFKKYKKLNSRCSLN